MLKVRIRAPTSMYYLNLCVQKVNSFEKFLDGTLHKVLLKATTIHEDGVHVTKAHL